MEGLALWINNHDILASIIATLIIIHVLWILWNVGTLFWSFPRYMKAKARLTEAQVTHTAVKTELTRVQLEMAQVASREVYAELAPSRSQ